MMGAIWRGSKQYFVEFESDKRVCGSNRHIAGRASSLKSAKSIIRKTRETDAENNPKDFKVYDSWAEVEISTNHVPCVYAED